METKPLVVSVDAAASALSTTKQTIYSLHAADDSFPRIFKVGKRKSGLLFSELERWIEERHTNHKIQQGER